MLDSKDGTTNILKVFGNIFISFIGAGVLGMPYAFKEAGILEGIFIMSVVGYLSVRAMLLLIECKDYMKFQKSRHSFTAQNRRISNGTAQYTVLLHEEKLKDHNTGKARSYSTDCKTYDELTGHEVGYGDVGYFAFGQFGSILVDIAIVVSQTGFCCAYLIFIIENAVQYISSSQKYTSDVYPDSMVTSLLTSNTQSVILATMILPLSCLCFLRQLHKLALFSLFADFANIFAYSIVFWFDFEQIHEVKHRAHPKEFDLSGFPFFAGMAVYCFEGAGMILSLEASMASEVRSKFKTIFKYAMFFITSLYILFGVCGYLSFGKETSQIITLNLPPGVFPLLVKLCLCFSLFFTYPVMMFPVVKIIEKRCGNTFFTTRAGNVLRVGMVMTTGFIVTIIPSFSTLMSLVGATFCSLLAFIMPALFHMKIFYSKLTKRAMMLDYTLIVVGIGATLIGVTDSLKRLGIMSEAPDFSIGNVTTTDAPLSE